METIHRSQGASHNSSSLTQSEDLRTGSIGQVEGCESGPGAYVADDVANFLNAPNTSFIETEDDVVAQEFGQSLFVANQGLSAPSTWDRSKSGFDTLSDLGIGRFCVPLI